jgi:AAA+ superfamily predicted ATPase
MKGREENPKPFSGLFRFFGLRGDDVSRAILFFPVALAAALRQGFIYLLQNDTAMIDYTELNDPEFEKLLDNFIKSSLNEISEPSANAFLMEEVSRRLTPYRSNGTKYMIPSAKTAPDYTFEKMEMGIDGWGWEEKPVAGGAWFRKQDRELSFNLRFDQISDPEKYATVNVLLYRQGTSLPLAAISKTDPSEKLSVHFEDKIKDLPAGRYFILLNNMTSKDEGMFEPMGGNARFPFRVLPDGEALKHPRIGKFDVTFRNGVRPGGKYASGKICFSFVPDEPPGDMDEYVLSCFNKDLRLMGKQHFTGSAPGSREMKLTLSSGYIWMPDSYFCILEHNREPFYKAGFVIGEQTVQAYAGESVGKNTADYILVKYLENESAHWKDMKSITGFTSIKYKLIASFRRNLFNRLRMQYDLCSISYNASYICLLQDGVTAGTKRLLSGFSRIVSEYYDFQAVDCARLTGPKDDSGNSHAGTAEQLAASHNTVVCLYNLRCLLSGSAGSILYQFEEALSSRNDFVLYLAGTASEVAGLFEVYPAIERFFPAENRLETEPCSVAELVHCLQMKLESRHLTLSTEAENALATTLLELNSAGELSRWNEDRITDFITGSLLPRFRNRVLDMEPFSRQKASRYLSTVEAADIEMEKAGDRNALFGESMKKLNGMVGLANLKRSISVTFNRMKLDSVRREMGFRTQESGSHHMIFTGNPGTGKTTVAKMIGQIYRSLGLLSKGDVIVTERSRMIGRYIGQTEQNMQAILAQAQGNVLFVDEAYALCDSRDDRKDFGHHVIESLLTVLGQKNPDMLVIFAGYEKEMERMMEMNPGLRGRFPYTFQFDDYSAEELMQIAENLLEREDYSLTREAAARLQSTIREAVSRKDANFSNARWVGQYVSNGLIPAMADRLVSGDAVFDRASCRLIELADVETAFRKFKINTPQSGSRQNRVGFKVE